MKDTIFGYRTTRDRGGTRMAKTGWSTHPFLQSLHQSDILHLSESGNSTETYSEAFSHIRLFRVYTSDYYRFVCLSFHYSFVSLFHFLQLKCAISCQDVTVQSNRAGLFVTHDFCTELALSYESVIPMPSEKTYKVFCLT